MINPESKKYASDPKQIKLWEIKYFPIFRTPEVQQGKKNKGKEEDCLIIDYGSSISRAVSSFLTQGSYSQTEPALVFNSLVLKSKRGKDDVIYVGNMIRESELSK